VLNQVKPLSFREKKMLDRAWTLLADEISIGRGMSRENAEAQLAKALGTSNPKASLPA